MFWINDVINGILDNTRPDLIFEDGIGHDVGINSWWYIERNKEHVY